MADDRFANGSEWLESLACAVLQPGLRGILVFNAQPAFLQSVATSLQNMWEITTGQQAGIVTLASTLTDDDVWGTITILGKETPEAEEAGLCVTWQTGLLSQSTQPQIVVIPDLTKASLTVLRAATVLLDSPCAELERNAYSKRWVPNLIWLAGCKSDEVGQVSMHLLDRFALRLYAPVTKSEDRALALLEWLNQTEADSQSAVAHTEIPESLSEKLVKAYARAKLAPGTGYFERLFEYIPNSGIGIRHEITLARLSKACAQLELSKQITAAHVDQAARVLGLKLAKAETPNEQDEFEEEPLPITPGQGNENRVEYGEGTQPQAEKVFGGEADQAISPLDFQGAGDLEKMPWPEELATIEHEFGSLRYPIRAHHARKERGMVIGTRKATNLTDISIFGSVMEAAKYRYARLKFQPELAIRHPIWPTDLRSYQRAPVPDSLLTVLLDYTCLQGWDWEGALLPYLQWAYINRAAVCLIQVGAATAQNELCAERVWGRNLLDPKIGRAFAQVSGKATPLAHGLELAYRTLQKVYQHGGKNALRARLVIITDGRGNVPISSSQTRTLHFPIGRQGVDDALAIALGIRKFQTLEKILLYPKRQQYAQLPIQMASALGANAFEFPGIKD